LYPQPGLVNVGWEENQNKPVSGNENCPSSPKKQHELVLSPIVSSSNSFSQNQPCINIKSSSLRLPGNEKGINPWIRHQTLRVQSLLLSTPRKALRSYNEIVREKFIMWICLQKYLSTDTLCL
jgi:hypothetical protein